MSKPKKFLKNNQFDGEFQKQYVPTLGMINNIKSLDCHILLSNENHTHKFTVNYKPLNIFSLLVRKRLIMAFESIASMTYELKVKQSNVFIPQALLKGDGKVIHEYKKILQKGRIESYIKLNLRRQQISRQKRSRVQSVSDRNIMHLIEQHQNINIKPSSQQKLTNKQQRNHQRIINEFSSQKQRKYSQIHLKSQKQQTQQHLYKSKVLEPNARQNIQNYLSVPVSQFREQIHHHHSVYHHKKTKSKSVANKSQKQSPFQGIKINYYEVKSNCKDNPQIATYVFPSKGIVGDKLGPKSVRQSDKIRLKQHSTAKTQMQIDAKNINKNRSFRSPLSKKTHNNDNLLDDTYTPIDRLSPYNQKFQIDRFSIHSHHIKNTPQQNTVKINSSMRIEKDDQIYQMSSKILDEDLIGGNNFQIGQRNLGKRKVNMITYKSKGKTKNLMDGFEMNMV